MVQGGVVKRPAEPEKKNKGEREQRYPEFSTLQSLHRGQRNLFRQTVSV